MEKGTPFSGLEIEHDFPGIGTHIVQIGARRLGGSNLILLILQDVTEERRWAIQQQTLTQELNHRVKNLLVTIEAIAGQTARHSGSIEEFSRDFRGRLRSIARAHDILSRRHWRDVDMADLVASAIETHVGKNSKRIHADCNGVKLPASKVLPVKLMLYELATNSLKYGALSVPKGRLAVSCAKNQRGNITFEWRESGGPPAKAPDREGFGTTLIRRTVQHELRGTVEMRYPSTGFRLTMKFPAPGKTPGEKRKT